LLELLVRKTTLFLKLCFKLLLLLLLFIA